MHVSLSLPEVCSVENQTPTAILSRPLRLPLCHTQGCRPISDDRQAGLEGERWHPGLLLSSAHVFLTCRSLSDNHSWGGGHYYGPRPLS